MEQTEKLSVTITAEHARLIRERIQSGAFASASEVIRAGLRALERDEAEHRERLQAIRDKIQAAIDDPRPHLTSEQMRARIQEMAAQAENSLKPRKAS